MLAAKFDVKSFRIGPGSLLRGISAIRIGENFSAGRELWLEAVLRFNDQCFNPSIVIGNNVTVSSWSHIAATNSVEIGDGVLIGSKVIITDHNHGQYGRSSGISSSPHVRPALRPLDNNKSVSIGSNAWLGDGVVVTAGSEVGEGAVIGANSVVCGAIPAFTLAVGTPARPVKQYVFQTGEWESL